MFQNVAVMNFSGDSGELGGGGVVDKFLLVIKCHCKLLIYLTLTFIWF